MIAPMPLGERGRAPLTTSLAAGDRRAATPSPVEALQRALGNSAMQRLFGPSGAGVQAKLAISTPGDEHEREADRVADAITRGSPRAPMSAPCKCGGRCAQCNKGASIQRSAAPGALPKATTGGSSPLTNLGAGAPLDAATRAFFEPRFGVDFGDVRVHTGPRAAESAAAIQARAYTAGRDIVFAEGHYAPHANAGQRLLAHELTHVVQQGQGRARGVVQRDWADRLKDRISKGCISESASASSAFAKERAKQTGKPTPGSAYDAFGHCFTACCMTRRRSRTSASIFGRAYEWAREHGYHEEEDGKHDSFSQDTKNEAIGRELGASTAVPCEQACSAAADQRLDLSAPVTRTMSDGGAITLLRPTILAVRVNAGGQRVEWRSGDAPTLSVPSARAGTHLVIQIDVAGSPSPLLGESVTPGGVEITRVGFGSSPGKVSLRSASTDQVATRSFTEIIQWSSDLPLKPDRYQLKVAHTVKSEARIALGETDKDDFVLRLDVTAP